MSIVVSYLGVHPAWPRLQIGGAIAAGTGSSLALEKRMMPSKGSSLAEIFDSLCRLVEAQAGDVLASVSLVDGDRLRLAGAPSLPTAYVDAVDGMAIGPSAASCGTAAYRGEPVIAENIAIDPLWDTYRDQALAHALCACWSTPVFASQGNVIATFAMYCRRPGRPTRRDQEIIDQAKQLLGAAIQQQSIQHKPLPSEAYLAEVLKLVRMGTWVWDPRSRRVRYCSDEMFKIFGLDPRKSSPTRENFRQQIHPDDRGWVDESFERLLRERVDGVAEYRVVLPDGTIRHISASGHPIPDEDGELVEFIGTAVDVTERKAAELERRRLATLVEQAADLMAICDLSGGTPIYLNKAGMKMVGFDSWEEARTRRGIHYILPEDRPFVNEVLWPAVLEKGSWSGEMRFRHFKTGEPIPILYSAFRIDDPESGQPANVGNVCRDITELKRAEAQARENDRRYRVAQTELAHGNRVATVGQLTASIAHEVSQPIAATIINAQAALRFLDRQTKDIDEVRQILDNIVKDGNRAREVVSRIRDLIKKAPPRRDQLEINGAIREVIELTRGEAVSNGISVGAELADGLPLVQGDRIQLQQVVLNLIINAIEAMSGSAKGSRELHISSGKIETGGVIVTVRDSGPGLPPTAVDSVFESFYSTKPSGIGLGLSICRSIVEDHGGRLWARAKQQPWGATFQFTVPAAEGT